MPLISIITPVYNTPEPVLRAALDSVLSQDFDDWELCLVDDASPDPTPRAVLEDYARRDPRIHYRFRSDNGGIVEASNDALTMATGEFVSFLDHDDELYPGALAHTADVIGSDPTVDYIYTDEDKIDRDGRRHSPHFKPDWSPERMRCQMYTCHFGTMRRALVEQVGGFRADYEGSQDFDLVLRISEIARKIVHIPVVLYGWRIIDGSAAGDMDAKPYAWTAGQRAIQSHCDRVGFPATVDHDLADPGFYRLRPRLSSAPRVSIIIPTNGDSGMVFGQSSPLIERCVESIVDRSTYENYQIVVVADTVMSSDIREHLAEIGGDRLTILPFDRPFNFSEKINHGASRCDGEHLLLLNDDTQVISPDWLESMLMYSTFDGIGAVGARLLFEDGRIQHAGLTTCKADSGPVHLYHGFASSSLGYFGTLRIPSNVVAVTGACMMTPRSAFEQVGGMSLQFPSSYNDVDYCGKLGEAGLRTVYAPEAELFHFESMSRNPSVHPVEFARWASRWGSLIGNDPYYNRGLDPAAAAMRIPGNYGVGVIRRPEQR